MKKTSFKLMIVVLALVLMASLGISSVLAAEKDKYGGIVKRGQANLGGGMIGYPPEADNTARDAGAPAIETFMRVRAGAVFEPILATSWEVSPDRNSLTLTMRKNVKFQDGTDWNAEAAKWNLDKQIEAKRLPSFKSVDVIDDYKIRVNLKSTYINTVLNDLAWVYCISPTAVKKNGIEWARLNPVGTGPFILEKYERDARVVYKRNPNYWKKGLPYLDGLEIVVIPDETVRKIAFEKNDIQSMRAMNITAKELLLKGYNYNQIAGGTYVLIPDSANEDSPLANKKVRLAISYAINREALAKALGYGFVNPAYQIYPGMAKMEIPGLDKHEYNPDKAKALLAEAGYPDGFKMTIHNFTVIVPKDYANAIANMLTQVGIETKADFPEGGRYAKYRSEGWSHAMMGHGLFPHPNLNFPLHIYFDGMQFPSMKRPDKWRELMDKALAAPEYDPIKTREVAKLVHDEVMLIPYVEEIAVEFLQRGVHDNILEATVGDWMVEQTWIEAKYR